MEPGHAYYPVGVEVVNGKMALLGTYTVPNNTVYGYQFENRLTVTIIDLTSLLTTETVLETSPTPSIDGMDALVYSVNLFAMDQGLEAVWQDSRTPNVSFKATHVGWDSKVGLTKNLLDQNAAVQTPYYFVQYAKLDGQTILQTRFQPCSSDANSQFCSFVDIFDQDAVLRSTISVHDFRVDRIAVSGSSFALSGWDLTGTPSTNPNGYEDIRFYTCH